MQEGRHSVLGLYPERRHKGTYARADPRRDPLAGKYGIGLEQHYGGMLDADGNRTPLYAHVREANLYSKEAGMGLIGWDNEFVARYEKGEMLPGVQ